MPLISYSGEQAFANLRGNRASLWPDGRRDKVRLSGVADVSFEPGFTLTPGEAIFTVGSCFARNIERRLAELGFDVPASAFRLPAEERASETENDFLNKYPPHSILNEFRWALDPVETYPADGFLQVSDGLWHDPHSAPNLKPAARARVQERRDMVSSLYAKLPSCRVVVMTLGLVEAWFDEATGLYLNGAPPTPVVLAQPGRFRLDVLTPGEILRALLDIHELLVRFGHPDFRMLLTVSPVPFRNTFTGRDAISANTYSKSALRAAAEMFVQSHAAVEYFPSYEIVTNTIRTSAFIQDNRHVAPQTVDVIVDRVVRAYCPELRTEEPLEPVDSRQAPAEIREAIRVGNYSRAAALYAALEEGDRYREAGYQEFNFRCDYGRVLMRTGGIPVAQAQLSRAAELDPTSATVHYQLARALARLQRPLEAEVSFRRATELSPESGPYRLAHANQLNELGRLDDAEQQILQVLGNDPGDERAAAALSEVRARLHSSRRARPSKSTRR